MKYDSYIPCEQLRPYVQTLVISELDESGSYKVLPNTALVIGFQYRGKLSYILQEKEHELSSSGLTGLNDSFRIFKNSAGIGTVLVFFKETGNCRKLLVALFADFDGEDDLVNAALAVVKTK